MESNSNFYNVHFKEISNPNDYFFLEIPSKSENDLSSNKCFIKEGKDNRSLLITLNNEFELKFIETSNCFLLTEKFNPKQNSTLLENNGKIEIFTTLNHIIEANEVSISYNDLENLINSSEKINFSFETGNRIVKSNENKVSNIKYDDLIYKSCLSKFKIDKHLAECKVFINSKGSVLLYDSNFIYKFLHDFLLVSSNKLSSSKIISTDIYENEEFYEFKDCYKNMISNMNEEEKLNILAFIGNPIENNSSKFIINLDKIKECCFNIIKNLFFEEGTNFSNMDLKNQSKNKKTDQGPNQLGKLMNLSLFIQKYNSLLQQLLPSDLYCIHSKNEFDYLQTNCEDNIFDGLKTCDLRLFKCKIIIIFLNNKHPCVFFVDNLMLREKLEDKIEDLYRIKDKYTLNELSCYFSTDSTFKERISKILKTINDKNPILQFNNEHEEENKEGCFSVSDEIIKVSSNRSVNNAPQNLNFYKLRLKL